MSDSALRLSSRQVTRARNLELVISLLNINVDHITKRNGKPLGTKKLLRILWSCKIKN